MAKKKRKLPTVEDVTSRPWCYYCERDFDDLKILINHQKARHFKCNKCNRRLNTAGGLAVHLSQVHKDQLTEVEGALPNRKGLEVEIFGMEGIPDEASQMHHQRMTEQFFEKQAGRAKDTGNPAPGSGVAVVRKKPRIETHEELDTRFDEWLKAKREFKLNGGVDPMMSVQQTAPTYAPQPGIPQTAPGAPGLAPGQPPYGPPGAPGYQPPGLPSAPGYGLPNAPAFNTGLPQKPQDTLMRDVDDLISGAAAAAEAQQPSSADPRKAPPKKKKEENMRLVYSDGDISPEEKMASLAKYAFTPPKEDETVLQSVTEPGAGEFTGTADEDIVNTK